jgi:hypothetical protein
MRFEDAKAARERDLLCGRELLVALATCANVWSSSGCDKSTPVISAPRCLPMRVTVIMGCLCYEYAGVRIVAKIRRGGKGAAATPRWRACRSRIAPVNQK